MKTIEVTNQPIKQGRNKVILKTVVVAIIIGSAMFTEKSLSYLCAEYSINKTNAYVGLTIFAVFIIFPLLAFVFSENKSKQKNSYTIKRQLAERRKRRLTRKIV